MEPVDIISSLVTVKCMKHDFLGSNIYALPQRCLRLTKNLGILPEVSESAFLSLIVFSCKKEKKGEAEVTGHALGTSASW